MDLVPKEYKQKLGADSRKPLFSLGKLSLPKFPNLPAVRSAFLKTGIILALAVLIALCLGWTGLKFYQKSVAGQIQNLKEQQSKIFSSQDKELVVKIAGLENGAAVIQTLLKSHIYTSEILEKLAASTLPQVQLTSYGLDVKTSKIILKGRAANYSVLAKQILAFQGAGFLKAAVSEIALDKVGGVSFGLNFEFDPKIIQR